MRKFRVATATFAALATEATYQEYEIRGDGALDQSLSPAPATSLNLSDKAAIMVMIPTGVAAGVDKLRWKVSFNDNTEWAFVTTEAGAILETPRDMDGFTLTIQDVKGLAVPVFADIFGAGKLMMVPVDSAGTAIAPGAVVFKLSIKE